jgi:uncharacterized protein
MRTNPPTTSPTEFSLPVRDLDAGGREFRLPIRAAWLRGVLEGTDVGASNQDGELRVRLSKSGNDVVIRGSLEAEMTVPCSRCLEPTPVAVNEELSLLAVPGAAPRAHARDEGPAAHGSKTAPRGAAKARRDAPADEDEIDAEEADVLPYDGETLILDDLVRDELLLGIPMIPLCSEACPGISPKLEDQAEAKGQQGQGSGIDPRLAPLLELKKKS